MITLNNIQGLKTYLENAQNIVITAHKSPDGDSLGSSLGLYHFLKAKGIASTIIFPDALPHYLTWMEQSNSVLIYEEDSAKCDLIFKNMDLFIALDYNGWDRLGDIKTDLLIENPCKKIVIDHHQNPKMEVDIMVSDTSASSTSELVFRCIEALEETHFINSFSASCLYCGIVTDTGSFRFSSTSALTHKIAAYLMERGAQPEIIHSHIFDQNTPARLKLLGYILNEKMEILEQYQTVLIGLTKAEFDRFDVQKGDTEGFVNYGLSIKGIQMVAFVAQKKDEVRISFRSKGNIAVNELSSKYFQGGGHKNAAGGKGLETVEQTIEKIKEVLHEYIPQRA